MLHLGFESELFLSLLLSVLAVVCSCLSSRAQRRTPAPLPDPYRSHLSTRTRVPHLRRSFIAPKVGIERSETAFPPKKNKLATMYGPPPDCKGKVLREKVCVNVSGL